MEYRKLGNSGLEVSELSYGTWLTFSSGINLKEAKNCVRVAFEHGVNFFDTAEEYGDGAAELLLGEILRDYKREHLVISTKLFWGGKRPNQEGLSRKHLLEGIKHSLRRLQIEYVDVVFCHRPDPTTPIEETVRAMDTIIRSGQALYWGTSEWSYEEIRSAFQIANQFGYPCPITEQPQYNILNRKRVEKEYAPLYKEYGLGTTVWSPLASGILTGKYKGGMPEGSRFSKELPMQKYLTEEKIQKAAQLESIAQDIGCSSAQLALAWCLKNPYVSTVITGSRHPKQIEENLKSSLYKDKITTEIMHQIDEISTR
ncbi:MAG: aldo/keto reductase [Chlamydiales bacterium]